MKTVGLITEYNPFHNGHKYHIEQAKKLTKADYVVVVMSGNFTQRGIPSIIDKYTRTEIALQCGADLVFELPSYFATSSAENFAYGSINILEQLGFIDTICFGGEYDDLNVFQTVARILNEEPKEYKELLTKALKNGDSFPTARQKALYSLLSDEEILPLLSSPNSILGIEYLKALKRLNSPIKPYILKRKGAGYSDSTLSDTSFSSATAIRAHLEEKKDFCRLSSVMPNEAFSILKQKIGQGFPILPNDFSILLYYKLRTSSKEEILQFLDVSEELADRIYKQLDKFESFEQFAIQLKTKQYTLTRINRCLLHILLNIKKPIPESSYVRLLGFRKGASFLLKQANKEKLPIITKTADAKYQLSPDSYRSFCQDIACNDLYNHIVYDKYKVKLQNEYKHPLVILP